MGKYKQIITLILFLIFGEILGFCLFTNVNLRDFCINYYNGWFLSKNISNTDLFNVIPSTYHNPLSDILFYKIINKLNHHPYIFLAINNLKLGFFIYFSYLIYDKIFIKKGSEKTLYVALCTMLTIISPLIFIYTDYSFKELFLADFIILALLIIINIIFKPVSLKNLFLFILSGFFFGLAFVLEYKIFVYLIGTFICMLAFHKKIKKPYITVSAMLLGVITGFIYINIKTSLPLLFSYNINNFFQYNDSKILCTYIAIIIYFFLYYKSKRIKKTLIKIIDIRTFNFLILLSVITYLINKICFNYYTYNIALLPLTSLIIAVTCRFVFESISKAQININFFLTGIILLMCFTGFHAKHAAVLNFLSIIFIIFCILLIFFLYCKKNSLQNTEKISLSTLSIILIICITNFSYPYYAIDNKYLNKMFSIEKANIKDNEIIIYDNELIKFTITNQNQNAKYIFIPEDEHIDKTISDIIRQNKNVYYMHFTKDMKLTQFTNTNSCKIINVYFWNETDIFNEITICKIK